MPVEPWSPTNSSIKTPPTWSSKGCSSKVPASLGSTIPLSGPLAGPQRSAFQKNPGPPSTLTSPTGLSGHASRPLEDHHEKQFKGSPGIPGLFVPPIWNHHSPPSSASRPLKDHHKKQFKGPTSIQGLFAPPIWSLQQEAAQLLANWLDIKYKASIKTHNPPATIPLSPPKPSGPLTLLGPCQCLRGTTPLRLFVRTV